MKNKQELTEFLTDKWEYPTAQAPHTASKLLNMKSDLLTAFDYWLETGAFPEKPVYSGFSPRSLHRRVGNRLKPPAVFLLLDWIQREPSEALRAINDELL
jgi:hypothetical protein